MQYPILNTVIVTTGNSKTMTSVTRPNDAIAYSAGDVVGTIAATNIIIPLLYTTTPGEFKIDRVTLELDTGGSVPGMGQFILYLYDTPPGTPLADNVAWSFASDGIGTTQGNIVLNAPVLQNIVYWSQTDTDFLDKNIGANIYGQLVTVNAWTPIANLIIRLSIFFSAKL